MLQFSARACDKKHLLIYHVNELRLVNQRVNLFAIWELAADGS